MLLFFETIFRFTIFTSDLVDEASQRRRTTSAIFDVNDTKCACAASHFVSLNIIIEPL